MQLKTYFTGSVEEALARASGDLGPDAMLVYARETGAESRHLGRTEAVFAGPFPGGPPEDSRPPVRPGLAEVRAEIGAIVRALAEPSAAAADGPGEPGARARMIRQIRTDAALRRGRGRASVAVFIGPPGSGKTLSIVKLAARQIAQGQAPPVLVSFDNRIGGGEPLRSYAAPLECRCEAAALPEDAIAAIRMAGPDELVLVDTPGYTEADESLGNAIGQLISQLGPVEVHLALSAGMKEADLSAAVERFQRFRPTKLLFTRLDETGTYGPLWSQAVRWNLPVSFLAFGQQVPEDIEPATAVRLADLALRPGAGWLRARRKKAMGASA